ncbi:MAG: type II secretion system protein [Oscillospiraceae bacterium]
MVKKKGFTLIEVLASLLVMSICAVLTIQLVTSVFTVIKRSTDIKNTAQQSFDALDTAADAMGAKAGKMTFTVSGNIVSIPVKIYSQGKAEDLTKLYSFGN